MKNKNFIFKNVLLCSSILALVSCGKNKGNEQDYAGETPVFTDVYEDDYAYMWRRDGFSSDQNRMMFQSKNYAMLVDSKSAKITAFEALNKEHNEAVDINSLTKLDTKFEIKVSGEYYGTFNSASSRIISEGRHFNQWDNNAFSFSGPSEIDDVLGRVIYTGTRNFVAVGCDLGSIRSGSYGIRYSIIADGYTLTEESNVVKAIDAKGNGFYVKTLEEGVSISKDGSKIFVEKESVDLLTSAFNGISAFLIPIYNNSDVLLKNFDSVKLATVIAKNSSEVVLPTQFDNKTNSFVVGIESIPSAAASATGAYDVVNLELKNNSDNKTRPVVRIRKNTGVSITGINGVLRDSLTHEQTGEQVQITKNWHQFAENAKDPVWNALRKDHQGPWAYGIFGIDLEASQQINREYFQVYGKWGTTYAASHNQLCLIGWGGSKNELWDQSAMGSWGESVTYDPDMGLGRSLIDDVRPFLVYGPQGNYQQFNWSGNVGGADFLNYSNKDGNQRFVNQRVTYRTTGPNVTEVMYSGYSADYKIKSNIIINMGRTDDIVRTIYTIRYTFLEDVEYNSLSLFQLAADGYSDNQFSKYCVGDGEGVYAKDQNALNEIKLSASTVETAKHDDFFFGLYDSPNDEEKGDPMFIVRDYDAKINGKTYDKPSYRLVSTTNQTTQMSCKLSLPSEQGKTIKHGSYVDMVVEYNILPNGGKVNGKVSYYGDSDYLKTFGVDMGTHYACLTQAKHGKISVSATKGEVVANKPVIINAINDEAEFAIKGGLAYVPVIINGISDYKNFVLEKKINDNWVAIDQHARDAKDFYQVVFDEKTGKYEFAFNVKNDIRKESDFDQTYEYRFRKLDN